METVNFELIKRIRRHIERTEKQAQLLSKLKKWMQITSALDVLEDTSWAIEYYVEQDYPVDMKGKYLYTYGLLQALFVQQDAVNSISYALFDKNEDFKKNYPEAYKVREIRDDVVGHPTSRKGKQFIHLAQCSMTKTGFYYLKGDSVAETNEIIDVDVLSAINETGKCINSILENAIIDLDNEFREYIDRHRERKMKDIFTHLSYAKQKVFENTPMCEAGYKSIKIMVEKCENELVQRYGSVDTLDSYKYLLIEVHELFSLIDSGISQIPCNLQPTIKKYLLHTLFSKMEELETYCEETDSYFSNYGEEPTQDSNVPPVIIITGADDFKD